MYSGLTDSIWRGAGLKEATLLLNGSAVTAELASLSISGSVNGDQEEVAVGAACARTVTIQFSGVQNGFSDGLLKVSVAAGGETLPVGTFQVIESVTRGGQTTVTAADAMLYLLDKDYVPTAGLSSAWAVLSDIADQSGVTLGASVTGFRSTLAAVDMSGLTTGHTGRTVVGWLAALCGRNAVISRAGKLEFVWYAASGFTLGQQDCYEGMDQVQESDRVFSVLAVTGKPVYFQGTGEKLEDLEPFYPSRMAGRILGMGDVLSLIEKAQSIQNDKEAEEAARRMMENKFDMNDLLAQFQQVKKMGGASALLAMMPGGSQIDADALDEKALPHIEAIIYSMTPAERARPEIINPKRKRRIAAGSGQTVEAVNKLLRQYEMMQKVMKKVRRNPKGFMRSLGSLGGGFGGMKGFGR